MPDTFISRAALICPLRPRVRVGTAMTLFAAVHLCGCMTGATRYAPPQSGLSEPMTIRDARSARASSYDRSGGNADWFTVEPQQTRSLAAIDGPGCIKHIYWTYIIGEPERRTKLFRDMILRMYWDGEETPSVECPLGDFFGISNCQVRPIESLVLVANPGSGANAGTYGLNSYFPMPFAKKARIEITNDSDAPLGIWFHIDYETYTKTPPWLKRAGRFHAQFRRCNPTTIAEAGGINATGDENYVILEAEGRGALAGYMLIVDNITGGWWGEGDDMVFIDGESWPPSFHGTGSEEIFGGGACPNVEYSGPYTGFHLVENRYQDIFYGKNGMYRFLVHDPIRFCDSIRVTIEHGHANDLANDYSSVAYWYQREPHAAFPTFPSREMRQPVDKYHADVAIEGAIEAERLIASAQSSGDRITFNRYASGAVKWSQGAFLWLNGDSAGDFVSIKVPVDADGTYEVAMYLAKASDFGIFQLKIDGKKVGQPFEGYSGEGGAGHTHIMVTDEVSFGTVELAAGTHTFEFRLVGKNPAATAYMVGIDCILLRPVE